jgi:hypothetical protein
MARAWIRSFRRTSLSIIAGSFRSVCPGRKPPCLPVRRPARPCKSAVETQSTVGNAEAAWTPRAGPDGRPRHRLRPEAARRRPRHCPRHLRVTRVTRA